MCTTGTAPSKSFSRRSLARSSGRDLSCATSGCIHFCPCDARRMQRFKEPTMQKITPCLWFNDQAEEAARFYASIFKNSKIGDVTHFPEGAPRPKGTVMTVRFQLDGQEFLALNGGPEFKFT